MAVSAEESTHHHHHHHHHSESSGSHHSGHGVLHGHHGLHHHSSHSRPGATKRKKTNPRIFFSVLGLLIIAGAAIGLVSYNFHTGNVLQADAFEDGFDSAKDPEAQKTLKKRRGENLGARYVHVTKVIDGQTIEVARDDEPPLTVRIRGIECLDTANRLHGESQGVELNLDWEKVQWYGEAAATYVLTFVTSCNEVAIRVPVDGPQPLDDYGQMLTYVEIGNRDLGAELVRRGLAMASSETHPRFAEYRKLEEDARDGKIGMFGAL